MVLLWQRFKIAKTEYLDLMTNFNSDGDNSFQYWLSSSQKLVILYQGCQPSILPIMIFSFIRMFKTAPSIKEREEAARIINRSLTISLSREELTSDSYLIASLLFSVYRNLDQLSLISNALKVLKSRRLPLLESIPSNIERIWNKRIGLLKVDNCEYLEALRCFEKQSSSVSHLYIPLRILCLGQMPILSVNSEYYGVIEMIIKGDIGGYELFLEKNKKELLSNSSFSIWEKLIPLVWRSFIRRFYLFCSSNSRLSISMLEEEVERLYDNVDVLSVIHWICRLIDLKLIMGYCNWNHKMLVLSKGNPFPLPSDGLIF